MFEKIECIQNLCCEMLKHLQKKFWVAMLPENTCDVMLNNCFNYCGQGQPNICCYTSLCGSAGTTGCLCQSAGARSSRWGNRNWKDFHCSVPGKTHRWAEKTRQALVNIRSGSLVVALTFFLKNWKCKRHVATTAIVSFIQDTGYG